MIRARANRSWDVLAQHTPNFRQPVRSGRQLAYLAGSHWRCASSSAAGASTITFAAMPMRRCVNHNWAPAHRCCTTTAGIWRRRCRPFVKSATPRLCMPRSATRSPAHDCTSSRWPAGVLPSSFIRKDCCDLVGGRVVGRHIALFAVGGGTADAAATDADGAERAGNQPASGPVAGVGAVDYPGVGAVSGVGGVPCAAVDFGVAGRSANATASCWRKTLGQTGIVGQRLLDEPAWYWPD